MTKSIEENLDIDLQRTTRNTKNDGPLHWKGKVFTYYNTRSVDCTDVFEQLKPNICEPFKEAIISFTKANLYPALSLIQFVSAIRHSLRQQPDIDEFNAKWAASAILIQSVLRKIGMFRNFFSHWQSLNHFEDWDDMIEILAKATPPAGRRNILSDDPTVSWLTDNEYDSIVQTTWHHYDTGNFTTSDTAIKLLSMQYARRPSQIAQLKICDIRTALPGDSSGLTGEIIDFPGVKDILADDSFRNSKSEPHPLPEHLQELLDIQVEKTKKLFESTLAIKITTKEAKSLPLFSSATRIKKTATYLTKELNLDLRKNLDHELFHIASLRVSQITSWTIDIKRKSGVPPPISERTGEPIVITATRMRHTRARQLARQGIPLHVLSHWLGHTTEHALEAYYDDPAEDARILNEAIAPALTPIAMAFAGNLIDSEAHATRHDDPTSRLELANDDSLIFVGNCGKYSFCATTSIPIPCYRCRHFEPIITAPHDEVLNALLRRQEEESQAVRIGGTRNLLVPIDLSLDIRAVQNCIIRCNARKIELGMSHEHNN